MTDKADKDAEELLPCHYPDDSCLETDPAERKCWECYHRPALAAALRKRDERIKYWQNLYWRLADRFDKLDYDTTVEIERLKRLAT